MKKNLLLFLGMLVLCLLTITSAFAQVPADQKVIVIEGGFENVGSLETTINSDKDENGNRINPNRVYQLKKNTVYIQVSGIEFGGAADSTATLNIIGEEGGNLPVVLMNPTGAATKFENLISGSLTLKNVYWPSQSLKNDGGSIWKLKTSNSRIIAENLITDFVTGGSPFHMRAVLGKMSLYFKNCYFRDNTQFENPWNHGMYQRGDNGEPFDTLWIENTTISNAGMPLFGKFNPVNFLFLDHNTFVNTCKYPIWHEQYKEAYITNNLFINANYEGEDVPLSWSQLSADGTPAGLINLHPIDERFWDAPPAMEDVIFLAANNLSHRSPFLDGYYNGELNDKFDKPMSYRTGGPVDDTMTPTAVENIRIKMFNDLTKSIIAEYPNYKIADNHDMDKDPQLVTKGMASQEVADAFIQHMRANYSVPGVSETRNKEIMYFGDVNPGTVPGIEIEDGNGFAKISDLIEDFSYSADVRSTIDNKPLGALTWWDMEYDGAASLELVKAFYEGLSTDIADVNQSESISIYPNPANNVLQIAGNTELKSVQFYNILGKMVRQYNLHGEKKETVDISDFTPGIYIVNVEERSGKSNVSKIVKK